ncbi:MAG: helix-turn-helix transcriptional regulator [Kineosporiaceae bacterium]
MSDSRRPWTINELAEYLQLPKATLYKWRATGEGPRAFRVGKHLRYDPRDVEAWMEDRKAAET